MESSRFDTMTRALSAAGSRRRALAAALGGSLSLLGAVLPDDVAAAKSGKCRPKCGECEKCKKGACRRRGKRVCKRGKCRARVDGSPCSTGSCQGGVCNHLAGTCTPTQVDDCELTDNFELAACNSNPLCFCFTTTRNARFCAEENYCPVGGCAEDADCPGDDACVKILTQCNGCPASPDAFCAKPCGS
jgi:hypothetical protein